MPRAWQLAICERVKALGCGVQDMLVAPPRRQHKHTSSLKLLSLSVPGKKAQVGNAVR